jgi:hypothetical protein
MNKKKVPSKTSLISSVDTRDLKKNLEKKYPVMTRELAYSGRTVLDVTEKILIEMEANCIRAMRLNIWGRRFPRP